MECLDNLGTLYKIKPRGDRGLCKVIHRTEIKFIPKGAESRWAGATRNQVTEVEAACDPPLVADTGYHTWTGNMEGPNQVEPEENGLWTLSITPANPPILRDHDQPTSHQSAGLPSVSSDVSPPPPPVEPVMTPPIELDLQTDPDPSDLDSLPVQPPDDVAVGSVPRRSSRCTAGQHSNPYHLPLSVA